jgi:hypothetical protein
VISTRAIPFFDLSIVIIPIGLANMNEAVIAPVPAIKVPQKYDKLRIFVG